MEYITKKGDTFDQIAYEVYGNEEMIQPLIESNPQYTEVLVFDYGTKITVPDIDTNSNYEFLPSWRK